MKIVKFAHNKNVSPAQFWIEYEDGKREDSTQDKNLSLWFVWMAAPGSCRTLEGDWLVFNFGKDFIKENDIYKLVKRKDEDRKKYLEDNV